MVERIKTHKDLLVWQKSVDFITDIYEVTKTFPSSELFGLTSQIRRAATSIPANIAEGAARKGNKELTQFLYIALGSATELDTFLTISRNLNYIKHDDFNKINKNLEEIRRMLIGLINSIKNKQ